MKRGFTGMGLIEHEGEVIGIAFGSDACTEHECGIATIRTAFGMDDSLLGIERSRARTTPPRRLDVLGGWR